jgi:hypothetical protein
VMVKILSQADKLPIPMGWESVYQNWACALDCRWFNRLLPARKKLKACCGSTISKGGRMIMIVEAFHHQPLATWYTKNSAVEALTWTEELWQILPVGGLLIFEVWFFNFLWFDGFTDTENFFVTGLRPKTAYLVTSRLSRGILSKDEMIKMGLYRSNSCKHPVRLVSVFWGKTWYYYLRNVKDPEKLSAGQVCELYRRR